MVNGRFEILKRLFHIVKDIDRNTTKAVTEVLPIANATIYFCSETVPIMEGVSSRYLFLKHSDTSLCGDYNLLSVRNEIYVDGVLNLEKSRSYYLSIPRFLLAILDIIQDAPEEDTKLLKKYILAVLSTTYPVSHREITYSSSLSVSIRHSLGNLKALRDNIKTTVAQEQNLCFAVSATEKFSKSVFSLLVYAEKTCLQQTYNLQQE